MHGSYLFFSNKPIEYSMLNGSAGRAANHNIYTLSTPFEQIDRKLFRLEEFKPKFDIHKPLFNYDLVEKSIAPEFGDFEDDDYVSKCCYKRSDILAFKKYDPYAHLHDFIKSKPIDIFMSFLDDPGEIAQFVEYICNCLFDSYSRVDAIAYLYSFILDLYVALRYNDDCFDKNKIHGYNEIIKSSSNPLIKFLQQIAEDNDERYDNIYYHPNTSKYNVNNLIDYSKDFEIMLQFSENELHRKCLSAIIGKICDITNIYSQLNIFCTLNYLDSYSENEIEHIISSQHEVYMKLDKQHRCIYVQLLCLYSTNNSQVINIIKNIYKENFIIFVASSIFNNRFMFTDRELLYTMCMNISEDDKNIIRQNYYDFELDELCDWNKAVLKCKNEIVSNINFH